MLCTLKIKLATDENQFNALLATMKRFNQACNNISQIAFNLGTFSKFKLQKACYYEVREQFGLSSQMVVRAIGKVSESYKTDKKTLHTFKDTGAMVYDERILSFKGLEYASLLTLDGRIEVPMILGRYHQGMLFGTRVRGQADLILQNNIFYLMLIVDVPETETTDVKEFLGVDLGIVNIATDSTGENFSGDVVNTVRERNSKLRAKLQSKGTKSAKRLLKKRSKKEKRFVCNTNHVISKKIVEKAKALGMGISLEDLKGIRQSTEKTVRKQQRYRQSSWAFYQLMQFIIYKAIIAGVVVVLIDPKNTSRTCPVCDYTDKKNRKTRDDFCCLACGYAAPADNVAAVNISRKAMCQLA